LTTGRKFYGEGNVIIRALGWAVRKGCLLADKWDDQAPVAGVGPGTGNKNKNYPA